MIKHVVCVRVMINVNINFVTKVEVKHSHVRPSVNLMIIDLRNCGIAQSVYRLATGWTTSGAGVRVPVGSKFFTSLYRPDRLWGPPNLL
jgi:hypothetical protein